MIKVAIILGLSCLNALFYRLGGWSKGNKLFRRLGCPIIALIALYGLVGLNLAYWWVYLLFIGLNYGALSTYHDYLAPDGSSEDWLCWWVTGLTYSLASFPICIITGLWLGFIIRSIVLSLGIMLLRENTGNVIIEETGSGFLYVATIPLLLI